MSQTPTPFKRFVNVCHNVNSVEKGRQKMGNLIKAQTTHKNTHKNKIE